MDDLLKDQLKRFSWPVLRREPAPRVSFRSEASNERYTEDMGGYSPVYDPPRMSDFNTRPARMPIYTSFAIEQYFAVQRDEFLLDHELEEMAASTPSGIGSQSPWRERTNITRPPAVAYGSMVVLQPQDPYITLRSGASA